jgi:hypothetical protein
MVGYLRRGLGGSGPLPPLSGLVAFEQLAKVQISLDLES